MKFTVQLDCDNFAFDEAPTDEVARILQNLAKRLEREGLQWVVGLTDLNGNRVGEARWEGKFE